jgi:hypothetical protein
VVRPFEIYTCTHSLPLFVVDHSSVPIDLSKATKLKDVVFQPNSWRVEWIATTLQTITPKHRDLQQISIRVAPQSTIVIAGPGANGEPTIGEPIRGRCLGLDHLLVQLWVSHSIRPKVMYTGKDMRGYIGRLLPEIAERGIVDLVECASA